jgi:serine/threonine protein kinase
LERVKIKHAEDLIEKCTSFNPEERPSIDEIRKHNFFTDESIENIILDMTDNGQICKLKEIFNTRNEETSTNTTETNLSSILFKKNCGEGTLILPKK